MFLKELFKAVADETRLRLLNLLIHYELNVNEIVSIFEMGQSRISRHLKILTDCGLLQSRRDGLWIFYKVAYETTKDHFISDIKKLVNSDLELTLDLEKNEEKIKEIFKKREVFFDEMAPKLDIVKSEIFGDLNLESIIVQKIKANKVFADLGCGNGELLIEVSEKMDWLIGVDRSRVMLEESKRKFKEKKVIAELRIGELEKLPIDENEIDFGIINMVLHHMEKPEIALSEASRVIKSGGELLIVELDKHSNEKMRSKFGHRWLGFLESEIAEWLNRYEFKLDEIETYDLNLGLKMKFYHTSKV